MALIRRPPPAQRPTNLQSLIYLFLIDVGDGLALGTFLLASARVVSDLNAITWQITGLIARLISARAAMPASTVSVLIH